MTALVRRLAPVLRPDPTRVVTTLFLPGEERMAGGASRSGAVLARVMALPDADVERELAQVIAAFGDRHRGLAGTFSQRYALVAERLGEVRTPSEPRRLLAGAYFSQEYAVESAALFNPSLVAHPDQSGLPAGSTRFAMSVRAVGEGHISSIGWRTGRIDAADEVRLDVPTGPLVQPEPGPNVYVRAQFLAQLPPLGAGDAVQEAARRVLEGLGEQISPAELARATLCAPPRVLPPALAADVGGLLARIAASHWSVGFDPGSALDARVLLPIGPAEDHGLEDLRLVLMRHPGGQNEYVGTYTAFDGRSVAPALLRSPDLRQFHAAPMSGTAARNKGMALFGEQVGGRYLALSRWDRESISIAESANLIDWHRYAPLAQPVHAWEIVQIGNGGSPLRTEAGWLVLTHGVGPVRQYGMGAMLLDLDDPSRVLGSLERPLLTPTADERDGYVPNVVYSCGAMLHGGTLVLPYGCGDSAIRIALVDLEALLDQLTG